MEIPTPIPRTILSQRGYHKIVFNLTPNLQSANYLFTDNFCSYFTATCLKATRHSGMAFALFTGIHSDECIEWIPKVNFHPSEDDRSVSDDNLRFTARMQKDGNDCLCYMLDWKCYAKDEEQKLTSQQGYPCQYLQVSDSCIVYHVNYELRAPLPPNG